jgi:hypothetical protein
MARAGYGDLEVGAETSSVQAVHPVGTAAAPGIAFSTDTDVGLYLVDANQIGISAGGTGQVAIIDGVLQPITTNDVDLGTASLQFKNAWFDGTLEADAITMATSFTGAVTGAVTGAASEITASANNSTDETVYPTFVDGATGSQGIETDTGLTYNPSSGILTTTQVTGALSGNATSATTAATATEVTVSANNSTDETVYPLFVDGATGGQGAETDTGLTYNPNSGVLTATQFTGAVSGTASLATEVTISANNSTDETVYPVFVDGATGTQGVESDTGLTYNPNSGILTTTTFTGGLSGNATSATTAALATEVTISANNSTDETVYPTFVDGATGTQGVETDTGLTYNPSTGVLTATQFTGAVSGTITGTSSEVDVTANNSTDETVYPVFVDGATGSQGIESDTGLTYNPSSGILTGTQFTGAVSGNATTATTAATATLVTASANNSTDETVYPTFVDGATGGQDIETDTGFTYNPSSGILTSTQFTGALSGNATTATTATDATSVTASANNSTNETVYPTFVDGATGSQGIETDTGLTYNPSTGVLTATTFSGNAGKSVGFIIAMA